MQKMILYVFIHSSRFHLPVACMSAHDIVLQLQCVRYSHSEEVILMPLRAMLWLLFFIHQAQCLTTVFMVVPFVCHFTLLHHPLLQVVI